ncbi:zinc finger protein 239-like [Latimeria chalumnae]|uniref:zinc finger protein 239-like n=1 Tax=Latimeria chalumnae TaxID=7897 RepID=UPI0003C12DF3|nr:PREDICTED: zinc finger protein 239-like [Latimeria chalumnae]XP_014354187.1 PREDICTED: zinc finger protein 239-like [Latimeria chalumnae]|eukprot:XP_006012720.1 PREDICTED: zinc finger protein 239-like [Latimeria chalumnae]
MHVTSEEEEGFLLIVPVWEVAILCIEEETRKRTVNPDQLERKKTFEDIEKYFTKDVWEELQDWEKEVYRDIKEHYDVIISFGYKVPKPDFMSEVEESQQFSLCEHNYCRQARSPLLPENYLFNHASQSPSGTSSSAQPFGRNATVENSKEKPPPPNHLHLNTKQELHTEGKPHRSSEFEKSFIEFSKLKLDEHNREELYICSDCGRSFKVMSVLRAHQQNHKGEKLYSCTECGKSFSTSSDFNRHKKTHTGEKPYNCTECGKNFTRLSSLKTHQRIHIGEKSYMCTECGKGFTHLRNLKKHEQIHTGEKPFKCAVCGESFSQSGTRNRHQLIHTGEKPYECAECGERFSQLGSRNRHQQMHRREIL